MKHKISSLLSYLKVFSLLMKNRNGKKVERESEEQQQEQQQREQREQRREQ